MEIRWWCYGIIAILISANHVVVGLHCITGRVL